MKVKLVVLTTLVALTSNIANANETIVVNQAITEKEAVAAQQAWCRALLDINAAYEKDGQAAAKALAEKVIDSAYAISLYTTPPPPSYATHLIAKITRELGNKGV